MRSEGDFEVDFLIIGTQKAGTTWLARNLSVSDEIFMPRKQIHYFDVHFDKGLSWYRRNFAGSTKGQRLGEKTTEYFQPTQMQELAERIKSSFPDVRLVLLLRDPRQRAWSAMIHHVTRGLTPLPENPQREVFERDGKVFGYIERGFYAQQLLTLFEHFDRAKVLVLIFEEDVVAHPQLGLQKVSEFLGLQHVVNDSPRTEQNKMRLSKWGCRQNYRLRKIPYARSLIRRIDKCFFHEIWDPKMSPSTRMELQEVFDTPNQQLFALLGREIGSWIA